MLILKHQSADLSVAPKSGAPADGRPAPALCSLAPISRLFILVSRGLVFQAPDPDDLARMLSRQLGASGSVLIAHHFVFMKLLAQAAPQRLHLHPPNCPYLEPDEQFLAAGIAAMALGQIAEARGHLQSLLGGDVPASLMQLTSELGQMYHGRSAGSHGLH